MTTLTELTMPVHLKADFVGQLDEVIEKTLPYRSLGGAGFERLCYLLLVAQREVPRYFGLSGQAQYGIDLLSSDESGLTLYQCKNVSGFGPSEARAVLSAFESQWLAPGDLPKPQSYVLCCPLDLRELRLSEEWLRWASYLRQRYQVTLGCWDRSYLDVRLKELPGIVADVFSVHSAERYCEIFDWDESLFRPLRQTSTDRLMEEYLALEEAGGIYLRAEEEQLFIQALAGAGTVLIAGPPGSGKTVSALAMSATYDGGSHRIFYLDLRYEATEGQVVTGVKRRLVRPTIFILDNCQSDFEKVSRILERVHYIDGSWPCLLVLIARMPLVASAKVPEEPELVRDLREDGLVLERQVDAEMCREIVARVEPGLQDLDHQSIQKLLEISGRDLVILKELLDLVGGDTSGLDDFDMGMIFGRVMRRYFPGSSFLPGFFALASLAQFDIAPLAAAFSLVSLAKESERLANELVVSTGRPPRHSFLHSTGAELLARAISWRHGDSTFANVAAIPLIEYFRAEENREAKREDLWLLLQNRLRLGSDLETGELKSLVATEPAVRDCFAALFELRPLRVAINCLQAAPWASADRFTEYVFEKVENGTLFAAIIESRTMEAVNLLRTVQRQPRAVNSLRHQIKNAGLERVFANAVLTTSLSLVANISEPNDSWWLREIEALRPSLLLERAAAARDQFSPRALRSAFGELGRITPDLFAVLLRKLGPDEYFNLILGRSSFGGLLRLMASISSSLELETIVPLISEEFLDRIVVQAVESGETINMLGVLTRSIAAARPDLLRIWESKFRATRYLRLISENGDLQVLFGLLNSSTLELVDDLLKLLDAAALDGMLERSLVSARPIGTLHFALRRLRLTDQRLHLALENAVGPDRYIRLLRARGTLPDLLAMVAESSKDMAEAVIDGLSDDSIDVMLMNTVSLNRGVGALHLRLREISSADPALAVRVEARLGARRFAVLLSELGDLTGLLSLLNRTKIAREIVEQLDGKDIAAMLDRSLSTGRGVGSLPVVLKNLAVDSLLRESIDRLVTPEVYVALYLGAGDVVDVCALLRVVSPSTATAVIEQLDGKILLQMTELAVRRRKRFAWLPFTFRQLRRHSVQLALELEQKMGVEVLELMVRSSESISPLFSFLHHLSPGGAVSLLERLRTEDLDVLIQRTIESCSSVGALAFGVRRLRKEVPRAHQLLESAMTTDRWWRLVSANGNAESFQSLTQHFSFTSKSALRARLLASPPEQLASILGRSSFLGVCRMLRWALGAEANALRRDQLALAATKVDEVVSEESWRDLQRGLETLEDTPESELKALLKHALRKRLTTVDVGCLRGWSLAEAAGCAFLLCDQEGLTSPLEWLPDAEEWSYDSDFLRAASLALWLMSIEACPAALAERVLRACNSAELVAVLPAAHPYNLTVFLLNVFGAWSAGDSARRPQDFCDFVLPVVREGLVARLAGAPQEKSFKSDREAWLALAGICDFLNLQGDPAFYKNWVRRIADAEKVQAKIMEEGAATALLSLSGLEKVCLGRVVIRRLTWQKAALALGKRGRLHPQAARSLAKRLSKGTR